MPDVPDPAPAPGPLIDELCDRFEEGWQAGTPVPLEEVVRSVPEPLRPELFRELLALEREYRAKAQRPLTVAEARERFAEFGPWTEAVIQELLSDTRSWVRERQSDSRGRDRGPRTSRIGHYELLEHLGRGGTGTVFKARHTQLKRTVALKVLFPYRVTLQGGLDRFRREMEALGLLSHPHIVRATDAGEANGYYYLAMEYVDGIDLGRVLKASRLTIPNACEVARQAAEALAYIERHSMVHRDIKPSNLLLGRDGVVRVLDLGLARFVNAAAGEGLTETGAVMGTADFIAPEQARESRDVDIRADIYSLGCTLYALLAGAPPFSGPEFETVYKKFLAHNEVPIPPLRPLCPELPAGLETLVNRMLEKDPAARPASPAEVARELAPFCAGHDLPGLVPPPATGSIEPPALPLLEPATQTLNDLPPGGAAPTTVRVRPEPRRRPRWMPPAVALVALAGVGIGIWLAVKPGPENQSGGDQPTGGDQSNAGPSPNSQPAIGRYRREGWEELITRKHTLLAWPTPPKPPDTSEWQLVKKEPGNEFVRVNAPGDPAVVQLASMTAESFDVEAVFEQNPWVGNLGVFVRGREEKTAMERLVVADYVRIEQVNLRKEAADVPIVRGRIVTNPERFATVLPGPSAKVPRLPMGEHKLTLTVGPRGIEAVLLDDKPVPDLTKPYPGEHPRAGASGSVGVVIENSSAVVHSFRVRTRPKP
jgi:serine/threonine protein kinase